MKKINIINWINDLSSFYEKKDVAKGYMLNWLKSTSGSIDKILTHDKRLEHLVSIVFETCNLPLPLNALSNVLSQYVQSIGDNKENLFAYMEGIEKGSVPLYAQVTTSHGRTGVSLSYSEVRNQITIRCPQ